MTSAQHYKMVLIQFRGAWLLSNKLLLNKSKSLWNRILL